MKNILEVKLSEFKHLTLDELHQCKQQLETASISDIEKGVLLALIEGRISVLTPTPL